MQTATMCKCVALLCIFVTFVRAQQEGSIVSCVRVPSTTNIQATFRLKRNGVDYTTLKATDDAGCTTSTVRADILELVLTFDEGAPTCGIVQDGMVATLFHITVNAVIDSSGFSQPYLFDCDSTNLLEETVDTDVEVKGSLNAFALYERSRDVRLQAVLSDTDLPAISVEQGRMMYYRLIYNRGSVSYDNTNWGRKFYIGFLQTDAGSTLSFNVYTPSYGTRVRVTGILSGDEIDDTFSITSTRSKIQYTINSNYQPTSVAGTWNTEDKGLLVEGLDDVIAVSVFSENGFEQTDSYTAYPLEALGSGTNVFRLPTMPTVTGSSAQAVIVATEDGTSLTITDDAGVGILPGGVATLDVSLDHLQTYHMVCGEQCGGISVEADKPVTVITGNGQDQMTSAAHLAHITNQVLPASKFGRRFVIFNAQDFLTAETHYKIMYDSPEYGTQTNWLHASGPTMLHDGDDPIVFATAGRFAFEELEIDPTSNGGDPPAASVTQFLTGTTDKEPSSLVIPPVEHWGTAYTLRLRLESEYRIIIVSKTDDIISNHRIQSSTGICCTSFSDFINPATVIEVVPAPGGVSKYSAVIIRVPPGALLAEWVKWDAVDKSKPFMFLAYEVTEDFSVQGIQGFGQRTSTINPTGGVQYYKNLVRAGQNNTSRRLLSGITRLASSLVMLCVKVEQQAPGFSVFPGVKVGDGIDNDCDGNVDEEIPNGLDDDEDGEIDEDLAEYPTQEPQILAIHNTGLHISADEAFTDPKTICGTDGCNIRSTSTSPTDAIASVGHFTESADDNSRNPDYWAIRTKDFPAYRIRDQPELWVEATVDFCENEDGLCLDSCATKRKRRDVTKVRKEESVYLHLTINDNGNRTTTNDAISDSCMQDPVFWSITTVLLLVNVLEISVIVLFNKIKARLLRLEH